MSIASKKYHFRDELVIEMGMALGMKIDKKTGKAIEPQRKVKEKQNGIKL